MGCVLSIGELYMGCVLSTGGLYMGCVLSTSELYMGCVLSTGELYMGCVLSTGELYMGCVLSTQAHARLMKVDPAPALAMAGVVDFVSHLDVPGSNVWGTDDEVFASTEVSVFVKSVSVFREHVTVVSGSPPSSSTQKQCL